MLAPQLVEGEDRVRRALAPNLAVVDDESGLTVDRRAHHREPQMCIGEWRIPKWRGSCRDETDLSETQRLQHLERRAHMPEVDRVESTAEDSNRHHAARRTPAMRAT